jgi:hypothetical protein
MAQRSIVIPIPGPSPRARGTAELLSDRFRTKELYDGPIGMVKLVLDFEGTRVTVGEVDESKLPRCLICNRPIPFDRVIDSAKRGRTPSYCGDQCRNIAGMRNARAKNLTEEIKPEPPTRRKKKAVSPAGRPKKAKK